MTINRRLESPRLVSTAAVVGSVVILVDILSKWAVASSLGSADAGASRAVVGSLVEIVHLENRGIAFGLLDSRPLLATVAVLVVLVPLLAVLMRLAQRNLVSAVAAGLVVGGAFANLLDRLTDSRVTDFVSVGQWPAFNFADAAISIGVVTLLILGFLLERPSRTEKRKQSSKTANQRMVPN